jgi:hypothetical protein
MARADRGEIRLGGCDPGDAVDIECPSCQAPLSESPEGALSPATANG